MIHTGKAQVFHGICEVIARAELRVAGLELAKPHGFEQRSQRIDFHGHRFDSTETPSLKWWAAYGASSPIL